MLRREAYLLVICFAALCISATPAKSDLFGFARITNNTPASDGGMAGKQLCVDVTEYSANQVFFIFYNNPQDTPEFSGFHTDYPVASSITDVYFDDGTLFGLNGIINGSGVAFQYPAIPGNLPGGNLISPPFITTDEFSVDSDTPIMANGVNPSETLGVVFDLQSGKTFRDVIAAIYQGLEDPTVGEPLRVGIHVQSIGVSGGSESFIMTPVPAAVILGILGLSAAGIKLRKFA